MRCDTHRERHRERSEERAECSGNGKLDCVFVFFSFDYQNEKEINKYMILMKRAQKCRSNPYEFQLTISNNSHIHIVRKSIAKERMNDGDGPKINATWIQLIMTINILPIGRFISAWERLYCCVTQLVCFTFTLTLSHRSSVQFAIARYV